MHSNIVYTYIYTYMLEIGEKKEKQKLTLGIDKDVIERAKAAGINISAMTEELLKSVTHEAKGKNKDDVIKAYEELFESMEPLIIKYDIRVEVGKICEPAPLFLEEESFYTYGPSKRSRMLLYAGGAPDPNYSYNIKDTVDCLYSPKTILENLVLELVGKAERNEWKIRELKLAKRFVEVLLSDIDSV